MEISPLDDVSITKVDKLYGNVADVSNNVGTSFLMIVY